MASLKRKQTLFSGVARKAKEIRQNSTNLAFDNKTNARKGSKIATADARLAIYVFYLSMGITPLYDQSWANVNVNASFTCSLTNVAHYWLTKGVIFPRILRIIKTKIVEKNC